MLGDLVEAELLVVVRSDPFGGVDRTALQRRVDVAAGQCLRDGADARHDLAAQAGNAHLEALEVGERLHLVAKPAAHLRAGVAGREADDAVLLEERVQGVEAAAVIHPRVLLPCGEAERQCRAEAHGEVFADVIVRRRVAEFDRALRWVSPAQPAGPVY